MFTHTDNCSMNNTVMLLWSFRFGRAITSTSDKTILVYILLVLCSEYFKSSQSLLWLQWLLWCRGLIELFFYLPEAKLNWKHKLEWRRRPVPKTCVLSLPHCPVLNRATTFIDFHWTFSFFKITCWKWSLFSVDHFTTTTSSSHTGPPQKQ